MTVPAITVSVPSSSASTHHLKATTGIGFHKAYLSFEMLTSVLRSLPHFGRTWKPLAFPGLDFTRLPSDRKIEEETLPDYVASRYYPVRIGEILKERYQVVGKLGFGASSTAWLARDMR